MKKQNTLLLYIFRQYMSPPLFQTYNSMQKIILATAAFLFSFTLFAQDKSQQSISQTPDQNGVPFQNRMREYRTAGYLPEILTTYTYDTVRALSEINNSTNADAYPWISGDGLRLYYTSGANGNQMMYTQRNTTGSYFSTPVIVPLSVPSPISYWLSVNELDVYATDGTKLYYAHRTTVSSAFGATDTISLTGIPLSFIAGVSLNLAQNSLFLFNSGGFSAIFQFTRTSPTAFAYTGSFAPLSPGHAYGPGQLSKDELTFFVAIQYDTARKSSLYQLTRPTPADTFASSTLQMIQGINDTVFNTQPSMSDSLNWVAFVRASTNSWAANDLYLAHRGVSTSVFDPAERQIQVSVFPNPSGGKISIRITDANGRKTASLVEICNVLGEVILSQRGSNELDLSNSARGIYFVKIYQGANLHTEKIVIE
jgi:hypothetical protein